MKRKDYQRPTMQVVELQHQCHIMATSSYETTGTGGTSLTEMEDDTDL
jgi:hypothetical protein